MNETPESKKNTGAPNAEGKSASQVQPPEEKAAEYSIPKVSLERVKVDKPFKSSIPVRQDKDRNASQAKSADKNVTQARANEKENSAAKKNITTRMSTSKPARPLEMKKIKKTAASIRQIKKEHGD